MYFPEDIQAKGENPENEVFNGKNEDENFNVIGTIEKNDNQHNKKEIVETDQSENGIIETVDILEERRVQHNELFTSSMSECNSSFSAPTGDQSNISGASSMREHIYFDCYPFNSDADLSISELSEHVFSNPYLFFISNSFFISDLFNYIFSETFFEDNQFKEIITPHHLIEQTQNVLFDQNPLYDPFKKIIPFDYSHFFDSDDDFENFKELYEALPNYFVESSATTVNEINSPESMVNGFSSSLDSIENGSISDIINDSGKITWTIIADPFCAPTAVCLLFLNNNIILRYLSHLTDTFSKFLIQSRRNDSPFDILQIPYSLWRTDPIDIIFSIFCNYSLIPYFNLFDTVIQYGEYKQNISNICITPFNSFESSIYNLHIISDSPVITFSFSRYGDCFNRNKFVLPLTHTFNEKLVDLYGFIYVINPLEKASHYIAVVNIDDTFFKLNGRPEAIEDIYSFMQQQLIVICMYNDKNFCDEIISRDINMDNLFTTLDFEPFKFHQNNPFLSLHPELNNSDYIATEVEIIHQHQDINLNEEIEPNEICYLSDENEDYEDTLNVTQTDNDQTIDNIDQNLAQFVPSFVNESSIQEIMSGDQNLDIPAQSSSEMDNSDLFSTNRFLYDALFDIEKPNMKNIVEYLKISQTKLKKNFQILRIPTYVSRIKLNAQNIVLKQDPPVYRLLSNLLKKVETFKLDSRFIEFAIPINDYHFDYYQILYENSTFSKSMESGLPLHFDFSTIAPDINEYFKLNKYSKEDEKSRQFQEFKKDMERMYSNIPAFLLELDGDQRFLINSHLSIAFLYGNVEIARAGVGSPHLKGTFSISARRAGTGYLNLDSLLNSRKAPNKEKFEEVMEWMRNNNPLYAEISDLNVDFLTTRIEPAFAPRNEVIGIARLPDTACQTNDNGNTDYNKIPISLPDNEGKSVIKYLSLEMVLALCFPMLFPLGIIPKIPGNTLKEKSLSIISSHEFYRCGRLQCSLILFLYNAISSHNAFYAQRSLSFQKTTIPNGSSRDIPSNFRRKDDPAFPEYWYTKQSQVRAMCAELGDPDLMVTFTFVNTWPEVKECEEKVNNLGYDKMDIRFCPFEEMMIWKNRFYDAKGTNFKEMISNMNFGVATNYCWRLEFQARGAPHVHALIWLENRLSLETISYNFFAHLPGKYIPRLHHLVTTNMIHTCLTSRCKGGIETANCKYGFPKATSASTHINSDGNLVLPRKDDEKRVVEYSPYFLLKWGGHCHINILRNEAHSTCSANAIHYIVKYNFKSEPNLRVEVDNSDSTYQTRFHARIVSVEEACTKISSVDYFAASLPSIYISIKSPLERQAVFKNGEQIQISFVNKYFQRPKELDKMGILSFFLITQ